jgi:hypothetical protein
LTLGRNELEKMMELVKDLSPEEQALHMLEQWVRTKGDNATHGKLFHTLLTIPLFYQHAQ